MERDPKRDRGVLFAVGGTEISPALLLVAVGIAVLALDLVRRLVFGDLTLASLLTTLWTGLAIGLAVGLAGIGLSMTYSILNFANFSHGDLVTTGAFTGWGAAYLVAGFGVGSLGELLLVRPRSGMVSPGAVGASIGQSPLAIVFGLLMAGILTVVVSLIIDRLVYKPMRNAGAIPILIASIGVALVLRYVIQIVYGAREGRGVTDEPGSWQIPVGLGEVPINPHTAALVVVSLTLMAGLHILLQYTKLGTAMRAMADNKDLAQVTGIPTERVVLTTWVIGGALTGMAGFLIVLERGTIGFNIGWFLLLLIFAAVILGGIGSIYGAMAGGVIIGVFSELSLVWLPGEFGVPAAFAVMIVVLMVRPEGIFGGVTTA